MWIKVVVSQGEYPNLRIHQYAKVLVWGYAGVYRKISKIGTLKIITVNILKLKQFGFTVQY